MFKLRRYFENAFDKPEISSEELRSFSEDHIGKLKTEGGHAAMLSATEVVFGPFDAALSDRAAQIGSLGGNTVTKNEVVQLFRTKIRQRRGRVVDAFGEGSAEYREIFPDGLSYYTKATMETLKQRLDYVVEKFTKYQAQLGAALVAEFEGLRTQFVNARDEQVGDKGGVSQARGAVKTTRTALEMQLTDNLLALAREFKGQPEKATEFFDQSLLEDPTLSQGGEPPAAT
jgi:hypothetical protein